MRSILKSIFTEEQFPVFMRVLARAITGHYEDKLWFIRILLGDRNSGLKGVSKNSVSY